MLFSERMQFYTKCVRVILLLLITISFLITLVVLGVDIDFLINGPDYVVKMITNVVNRIHEEEIVDAKQLSDALSEARWRLSIHIPLVVIAVVAILVSLVNLLGCAGAVNMSYSLLSGFTLFMVLFFIPYAYFGTYVFVQGEDSIMDNLVAEKISEYHLKNNSVFNLIIDTVQQDLECCGFKSSDDWGEYFPWSCCHGHTCHAENIFEDGCQPLIWSHLLETKSAVGVLGIALLITVIVIGLTAILSLCLCIVSRSHRPGKPTWCQTFEEDFELR